jgi:hypothetical protein
MMTKGAIEAPFIAAWLVITINRLTYEARSDFYWFQQTLNRIHNFN